MTAAMTARRRAHRGILEVLRARGVCSAEDMAADLGVTPARALGHLRALVAHRAAARIRAGGRVLFVERPSRSAVAARRNSR